MGSSDSLGAMMEGKKKKKKTKRKVKKRLKKRENNVELLNELTELQDTSSEVKRSERDTEGTDEGRRQGREEDGDDFDEDNDDNFIVGGGYDDYGDYGNNYLGVPDYDIDELDEEQREDLRAIFGDDDDEILDQNEEDKDQ